jgi:hypothetical protein
VLEIGGVGERQREGAAEQDDRAVVLGVPDPAAHALLEALHLADSQTLAASKRPSLTLLAWIERGGDTVDHQKPAGVVWEIDAVILVHQNHQADMLTGRHAVDDGLHVIHMQDRLGVGLPRLGRTVAGD